ncbi:MAG: integrase arm-type DNA-binding domain-containing protein [Hyphomicrobiaceae bacterium]
MSAIKVTKLKSPGLYEDGAGLRLVVTDKGTKRWALRLTIHGRRVERGLGVWPDVSLDDARRKASAMRVAAKDGRDLKTEVRTSGHQKAVTFKTAFETFFEIRRQKLSNGKHVKQWETTMQTYVFPVIGKRPVSDVTAAEVLAVLQPIWFSKPETASRVLQRMKAVFDSAILRGTRERANPCIGVVGELGTDHRKVIHHPALPRAAVPGFVRFIRRCPALASTQLAFEFLILTVARTGDVRGALWSEIAFERRLWTIPGCDPATGRRMKTGEPHVVPLSDRAVAILREARLLHAGERVFPRTKGQPLSDSTLSKLMRDAKIAGTPHGFGSAFKDWAAETGVRDEVSEAALAPALRHTRHRASSCRTFTPAQPNDSATSLRDFVSGA